MDCPPREKPRTYMKMVCVGKEERIVGLHVIGRAADEMLQVSFFLIVLLVLLVLLVRLVILVLLVVGLHVTGRAADEMLQVVVFDYRF